MSASCFIYVPSLLAFFLPILLLTSSCSTDFDPKIDESPLMVLNALIHNDSIISAQVSRSWIANQRDNMDNTYDMILPDAEAEYSVNDSEWLPMVYDPESHLYVTERVACEGDRVSMRARSRYGVAEGSTRVPFAVPIDKVEYSVESSVDTNSFFYTGNDYEYYHCLKITIRYRLTFTDRPGDDFYLISGDPYLDDPIISENETAIDAVINKYHYCSFFSDCSIRNKSYTLSLFSDYWCMPDGEGGYYLPYTIIHHDLKDTIRLIAMSSDYYYYVLSLFKKYSGMQGILDNFGLANPLSVFSNVSSGAGIIAAGSVTSYSLDVTPIILDVLSRYNNH